MVIGKGYITIAVIHDGVDGVDGANGYTVTATPSVITLGITKVSDTAFDADTTKNNKSAIMVFKGNVDVTKTCRVTVMKTENCTATGPFENGSGLIKVTRMSTYTAADGVTYPFTTGSVTVAINTGGTTLRHTVAVNVDMSVVWGGIETTVRGLKSEFGELQQDLQSEAPNVLTKYTSTIEQTAREISLSVSEKSIGRRNLLVGSAFLREDNHYILSNDARIEMNSGYNGTNCVKVIDDTDGISHYIGVYWDGSQGGRSVKIEKGKKYTISCYYKTNDSNAKFSLEAIYTNKETNAKRLGRPRLLSPNQFNPKYNQWQLFTTVIDTTDAESDYIAFNFWEYCKVEAGRINAYICRPMVEEGDTYNGWTLSQNDYDIIGANLIDNSRTLDVGGNILTVIGKKTLVGDVYELTASGSDDYNQFYRIKGDAFKLNTDYTLSFEIGRASCRERV